MAKSRSWETLRLAVLLWMRRGGGGLKRTLVLVRAARSIVRRLCHGGKEKGCLLDYSERELTFDRTPLFEFGNRGSRSMRLLRSIMCLGQMVEAEAESEEEEEDRGHCTRIHEEEVEYFADAEEESGGEEDEVDAKAEVFIAMFYKQLKLQRQISLIECRK